MVSFRYSPVYHRAGNAHLGVKIMIGQALIDGVRETVGIAGDPSGIRVV